MQHDAMAIKAVQRWRLVKWDGDPPAADETKEPIEIIEGGDDIPTRVVFRRPGFDASCYADLPLQEDANDPH